MKPIASRRGFFQVPVWSGGTLLPVIWTVLLVQAMAVSLLRGGTSFDGAEQLLYTQYLDAGYGRSQPPLYTWLLIGMQQIFGATLLAENLLKFSLAALALSGMARLGQLVWPRAAGAGAATVMLCLLVPEIFWEMQRNYSHSVLLFAILPWWFIAYLALLARPQPVHYFVFGLLVGLMILAKYNSTVMVAALLAADLWTMGRRSVLFRRRIFITVATITVLVCPHLVWAANHPEAVLALTGRLEIGGAGAPLGNSVRGLGQIALAFLGLIVLDLTLILCSLGRRSASLLAIQSLALRQRVVWSSALLFVVMTIAIVLFSGTTRVQSRWLIPVVVPLLAFIAGRTMAAAPAVILNLRRATIGVALLAVPGIWVEGLWPGARTSYDYAALMRDLRSATAADVILFSDYAYFANLRLGDPAPWLLSPAMPRQPGLDGAKRPVAVWLAASGGAGDNSALAFAATLGFVPAEGTAPIVLTLRPKVRGPEIDVMAQLLQARANERASDTASLLRASAQVR